MKVYCYQIPDESKQVFYVGCSDNEFKELERAKEFVKRTVIRAGRQWGKSTGYGTMQSVIMKFSSSSKRDVAGEIEKVIFMRLLPGGLQVL